MITTAKRKYHPPWSEQEIVLLRRWSHRINLKSMARLLGRSKNAVKVKSLRLGIRQRGNRPMSAQLLSRRLGVDNHAPLWWIANNWIEAREGNWKGNGREWWLNDRDVDRFLRVYPFLVRRHKIKDARWRRMVDQEWEYNPWFRYLHVRRMCHCCDETLRRALAGLPVFTTPGSRRYHYTWIRASLFPALVQRMNSQQRRREAFWREIEGNKIVVRGRVKA